MSPFENGVMGFLGQVELLKYADVGANFLRTQGYPKEILNAYKEFTRYSQMLKNPNLSIFHKDNISKKVQAAESILQKNLKGSDWKTVYKGRKGLQPALADRQAFRPAAKGTASTGAGRAAVFEGKMLNQPGGEARLQALRQQTKANTQQQARSRLFQPLSRKDIVMQEHMMAHGGKAPSTGTLNRLMRNPESAKIKGGPTQDWTWSDRTPEVKAQSQPYYGGRGGRGPKIHTHPQQILAGEPGSYPMNAPPIPGTRAHAATTGQPIPHPKGMPRSIPTAPTAPTSGIFNRLKGLKRYGRGAAIVGGLGLGAYMLGRKKEPEQVKPVYGPMPSPLAASGYY